MACEFPRDTAARAGLDFLPYAASAGKAVFYSHSTGVVFSEVLSPCLRDNFFWHKQTAQNNMV